MFKSARYRRHTTSNMPCILSITLSLVFLFSILPAGPAMAALKQSLANAQQAYNAGRFNEAVEHLKPLELDYAGEVEFDYLLGRSALEARELNLAVAALSRAITVDPTFVAGRIQLARAYYNKGVIEHSRGAFEQARAEFENVLEQDPPRHIEKSIEDYINVIDKYLEVRHINSYMYVELATGFDSNIKNSSSAEHFSFYDEFSASDRTVKLNDSSQRTESPLGSARVGMQVILPLFSRYFDLFASAQAGTTSYARAHELDNNNIAGQVGAHHYGDNNKKTFSLNFNEIAVDGQRYADEFYTELEWAQRLDKDNQLTLRLVGGDINYENPLYARSVTGGRVGLEWTHMPESDNNRSEQAMLVKGRDSAQECNNNCNTNTSFRRDITGFRFGLSADAFSRSRLYGSLYLEASDYDETFFDERRKDHRTELFLGMTTRLSEQWQLRPELHLIHNSSTVEVYEYTRAIATINIRWGF